MSLLKILNDDPVPPLNHNPIPAPAPQLLPRDMLRPSLSPSPFPDAPPRHGAVSGLQNGGPVHPQVEARAHKQEPKPMHSDLEHVDEESYPAALPEQAQTPSKRRKKQAVNDDHQSGTRRSARRTSARHKRPRTDSPAVNDDAGEHDNSHTNEHAEDDRRLVSSDLDDCPEITRVVETLYAKEAQKRRKINEQLVQRSNTDKNLERMYRYTTLYTDVADRIPLPPPPRPPRERRPLEQNVPINAPPPPPPGNDYDNYDQATMLHDYPQIRSGSNGSALPKRPASQPASVGDVSDDVSMTSVSRPRKKRRVDDMDDGKSVASAVLTPTRKGKHIDHAEGAGSPNGTPRGPKKATGKRKFIETLGPGAAEHLGVESVPSNAGDVSPPGSRAESPAPVAGPGIIFELGEVPPELKKAKKMDDQGMLKRVRQLEDAQAKVWRNIVRREIPKAYRHYSIGSAIRTQSQKRIATLASTQARKPYHRTPKIIKEAQAKGKKLARDMSAFWKKNDKEERELRRKEQKEALERLRAEEEKREASRQARKLEFLISQTELYSHFVGNKLKTAEYEGETEPAEAPQGAELEDDLDAPLADIDFNDEDHTNLHRHARRIAQENVAQARARAQLFDQESALDKKTKDAMRLAKAQSHLHDGPETQEDDGSTTGKPIVDLDSDELNFQNPDALKGPLKIGQPRMLKATLKEYQLKGLNWLGTLYDQGINGILADEMGLGKTIQSISLIAYLAETHNIWGPFLVVAPASTLHNWQQEISRFVPSLKVLPYWGNVKDRTTLRKFWAKKDITYTKDSDFHVIVTSYQLVTQDQQYFQKVTWQYMILDEAQNIKNSASARWKTLLEFKCRNRLLLTGTPIQNSMQELWSLLHFIMPSLFDSHDEFNEWFSKDIENAAESRGRGLSEHQLRRLHMILKPFMLRRVKKHVQNELSDKIEIDVLVELSARQRQMYRTLLQNISIADLVAQGPSINEAEYKRTLTNLIMQFRKVCNHPELFDRADVVAPFSFAKFGRSGPLNREGDFVVQAYSTHNPIEYNVPCAFYLDGGLVDVPHEDYVSPLQPKNSVLHKLMNIWTPEHILQSLEDASSSSHSFLRFADSSPQDVYNLFIAPPFRRRLLALQTEALHQEQDAYNGCDFGPLRDDYRVPGGNIPIDALADGLPSLRSIAQSAWIDSCLSRPVVQCRIPNALAPPITLYSPDRNFIEEQERSLEAPVESLALYGAPRSLRDIPLAAIRFDALAPGVPLDGIFAHSARDQLPISTMRMPEAKSLILDSGKLARMDALLQELKSQDHRVLIYFQMTRMMDLMEEYLIHRQYKYLRLDGSTKIEDRRDMVADWQTREDIFIFILSTKAGGLGINLTAADTVIFYDHDWNPSNDAQAMDRAHRLGQTRQVTVYRLICRGSIDERIVQLARHKKDVQDMVVGNKSFSEMNQTNEMVQLLLTDEQIAAAANGPVPERPVGQFSGAGMAGLRDLWVEEGDEFFGASNIQPMGDDEGTPAPTTSRGRGRGRPRGSGEGHGRGRGRGRGRKVDVV